MSARALVVTPYPPNNTDCTVDPLRAVASSLTFIKRCHEADAGEFSPTGDTARYGTAIAFTEPRVASSSTAADIAWDSNWSAPFKFREMREDFGSFTASATKARTPVFLRMRSLAGRQRHRPLREKDGAFFQTASNTRHQHFRPQRRCRR